MKYFNIKTLGLLFLYLFKIYLPAKGQDSLETLLPIDQDPQYAIATFKGTRIINSQSIETPGKKDLQLLISHRFGSMAGGIHTFYGLDQALVRIGFDYGITNRLAVGIGRNSEKETYDAYLKYKLLRQSSGVKIMPVSVTLFAGSGIMTYRNSATVADENLVTRTTYVSQMLIARKFSSKFSFQLSPTFIHRNQVEIFDQNNVYAMGFAGRYKFSKRSAITMEYFYVLPGSTADNFTNSASIGIDIETGGHLFQINLSNSQGMIEQFYIPQTTGKWLKGDIRLGFNIIRVFSLAISAIKSDEKIENLFINTVD